MTFQRCVGRSLAYCISLIGRLRNEDHLGLLNLSRRRGGSFENALRVDDQIRPQAAIRPQVLCSIACAPNILVALSNEAGGQAARETAKRTSERTLSLSGAHRECKGSAANRP